MLANNLFDDHSNLNRQWKKKKNVYIESKQNIGE